MYTGGSSEFNTKMLQGSGRTFTARFNLNNNWYSEGIKKLVINGGSNADSNNITIGAAVSQYFDITMDNPGVVLEGNEILLQIGVKLASGSYEYVNVGYFIVQTPEDNEDGSITFKAYDRMSKLESTYVSSLTYPTTAVAVVNEIAAACGFTFVSTGLSSLTVSTKPKAYTRREAISYMASLYGKFAIFDRNGQLQFKWYTAVSGGYTVTPSRTLSFTKGQNNFVVSKLVVSVNANTSYSAGSGTKGISVSNPFATQTIVNNAYNGLASFSYRPSEVKFGGDIRLDPWDVIAVEDLSSNSYAVPAMIINQEYDGGLVTTIKAVGDANTEVTDKFTGPTTKAIDRAYAELLVVNNLVANKVDADYVSANYVSTTFLNANYLTANQIKANFVSTSYLNANYIDTKTIAAQYADIGLTNIAAGTIKTAMIDVGAIGTAQISDGSITDAKIVGLTANKITAGIIDASVITVTNLNCANLTVGTINGSQIGNHEIDTNNLSETLLAWMTSTDTDVDSALKNAGLAITTANNASSAASTAQSTASSATSTANTAQTTASSAVSIANGKSTVYYAASPPSGGTYKLNDVWYDTDDGYRMYYWSGSSWIATQFGSNAIVALAITTDKLAATCITAAKIASGAVTTDKVYANAITTAKIAAGAVTATQILARTITATQIAVGTITADNLHTDCITTDKIVAHAITAAKIAVGAITANEIASNAVTTDKLNAGAVTAIKIASGAITTDKLAANCVTANKIAAGSITADKLNVTDLSAVNATIAGYSMSTNDFTSTKIISSTEKMVVGMSSRLSESPLVDDANLLFFYKTVTTVNGVEGTNAIFYVDEFGYCGVENLISTHQVQAYGNMYCGGELSVDGAANVDGNINIGYSSRTTEAQIRFQIGGTHPHNAGFYCDPKNDIAIGCFDWHNNKHVWRYDSLNNIMEVYTRTKVYNPSTGVLGYPMLGQNTGNTYSCLWTGSQLKFYVDNTNVGSISDRRLKKNIESINTDVIDAIGNLELKSFNMNKIPFDDTIINCGAMVQDIIEQFNKRNIDYSKMKLISTFEENGETYYELDYIQFLLLRIASVERKLEMQSKEIELLKQGAA